MDDNVYWNSMLELLKSEGEERPDNPAQGDVYKDTSGNVWCFDGDEWFVMFVWPAKGNREATSPNDGA